MRFLKDLSQILLRRSCYFLGSAFLTAAFCPGQVLGVPAIDVLGWPVPDLSGEKPLFELGDDPVVGRQICPPLTRLNLSLQKSEDLLLKKVSELEVGSESSWLLEIRSGLFWWSGQQVSAQDLVGFIERTVPDIVQERGAGIWELPSFKVEIEGPLKAIIHWKTKPIFGPYILSGAPFYRPVEAQKGDLRFECVGLYQPHVKGSSLVLAPTRAYRSNQTMPEIFIHKSRSDKKTGGRLLEFKLPRDLSADGIGNDPQGPCSLTLELPIATMILWNTQNGVTKDPVIRRILTQLTPRGALVRGGTALLADLTASMVPRGHPGFHAKLPIRSFDIQAANMALDAMGYKRQLPGGLREGPDGKPLELVIASQKSTTGLPEKVISDSYTAAGVGVRFVESSESSTAPDGVLASFSLDWPRANLLGNFHSNSPSVSPYWPLKNQELDHSLEDYASSLTALKPDFSKLVRIQDLLYDLEPATVIFQHKACVMAGTGLRTSGKSFNSKDPDWFRQLLF
jgi:hypothetical protein